MHLDLKQSCVQGKVDKNKDFFWQFKQQKVCVCRKCLVNLLWNSLSSQELNNGHGGYDMRFDYLYRLHSTVGCFLRSFGFRQVSLGLNILNRITSSIPASIAACHERWHIAEILTNKLWALDFDPAASLWTSTKALILRSACSSHRLRFRPPYPYDTLESAHPRLPSFLTS